MAKTFLVLHLCACKDGRIWHTANYNPKPHPMKLLLKDHWPLLKELKNQKINKTLGFRSLCCLSPIIIV